MGTELTVNFPKVHYSGKMKKNYISEDKVHIEAKERK